MNAGECDNRSINCVKLSVIQLERQSARVEDGSKTSLLSYGKLVSIHQIGSCSNLVKIQREISLVLKRKDNNIKSCAQLD